MKTLDAICVYCGSRPGARPDYAEGARELGRLMAAEGITLVYGAGSTGIMGALADAALEAGGHVVGIIPYGLHHKELTHQGLDELHVVETMHERKAMMADRSDAFAALPGGFGTLEELFEALTWGQLGIHKKPCGLLNTSGYWDPLLGLLRHALEEGFIDAYQRELVLDATAPAELLDELRAYSAPRDSIWQTREQE